MPHHVDHGHTTVSPYFGGLGWLHVQLGEQQSLHDHLNRHMSVVFHHRAEVANIQVMTTTQYQ